MTFAEAARRNHITKSTVAGLVWRHKQNQRRQAEKAA